MPSKSTTKSRQGCWTCKARKVQCDQGMPACRRCTQARRECEGYGLRLSWPRDNDKKRSVRATVLMTSTQSWTRTRHKGRNLFINATFQDIELFRHLTLQDVQKAPKLGTPSPKLWRQPRSEVPHTELIYYFRDAAHTSLATFSPTTSHIRDVIMQMTFAHDTMSRRALFNAMLAFSSLHRSGLHRQAMLFKVAALEALSASAKEVSQGSVEATQHVAACMILCAFEILLPSESSGEWLCYIRGAMDIVQRAQLGNQLHSCRNSKLVDWVYYHDSMSRFTLYHWRHKSLAIETKDTAITPVPQIAQYVPLAEERTAPPLQLPAHGILNLLSEICSVLLDPSDPRSHTVPYLTQLRALEYRVSHIPPLSPQPPSSPPDRARADLEFTVQLYQIATRVYLARATQDPHAPPADLDALIDAAFAGPISDCYCKHFFPLLILACEARGDVHRAAILNLIERTEAKGYVRSMRTFRAQVEAFWVQRDLHEDGELVLNYLGLMRAIVSSNRALPSYV
ncbi:fungal-specific transcription factor domain-containing protein [Hypoxylon argillaceum]|nr:fungal-specific transcription factor domain-containing protein [Hypoxylon argillaceum]